MKKLNPFVSLALAILLFTACDKDERSQSDIDFENPQNIDYQSLKVANSEQSALMSAFLSTPESREAALDDAFNKVEGVEKRGEYHTNIIIEIGERSSIGLSDRYSAADISDVFSYKQRVFIAKYYSEMYDSTFERLDNVIDKYKNLMSSQGFSSSERQQLNTFFSTNMDTVEAIDYILTTEAAKRGYDVSKGDGFWDCMRETAGKKIGRGMAYGAISGGVRGAAAGAAGGTVAFPGLGTATGAVGGAVFGAAAGALYGAIGGALFAAADCTVVSGGSGGGISDGGCTNAQGQGAVTYASCTKVVDGIQQ